MVDEFDFFFLLEKWVCVCGEGKWIRRAAMIPENKMEGREDRSHGDDPRPHIMA